jgi:fumarate hydratase subunit alpha
MLRDVSWEKIVAAVAACCVEANCSLNPDVEDALRLAGETEITETGCTVIECLLENARIAREEQVAICQDTGMMVAFVTLGQEVHISGGLLTSAIDEGVRQGYAMGYLRKSVVDDPLLRRNTGDNTPAVIHLSLVAGDGLQIELSPKGFGSENMSAMAMLKPSEGVEGVRRFVVDTVDKAGANPCPPIVVGVGIGGTMEKAAMMAKHALLRPLGSRNPLPHLQELETGLLAGINRLGIGPAGFGGRTTALGVHVESYPTHIAGLPVAVNISCHVTRHASVSL